MLKLIASAVADFAVLLYSTCFLSLPVLVAAATIKYLFI